MSNPKRYERSTDNVVETGKTGIPASGADLEQGDTQFDAFVQAERNASINARRSEDSQKMEDRDNRGADELDDKGKTKTRIPMHEVDALAEEMASRWARDIDRVHAEANGNSLTVRITTRHGDSRASADVDDWTASGVKKALKEIEDKMNGSSTPDEPKDKLAEAVREIAKG